MTADPAPPRFAVVMRLFEWDPFIERQAGRFAASAAGGDFFLSVDDGPGRVPATLPFRAFRTTDADLAALGLPARWAEGSLVWWNSDYPAYAFRHAFPGYDHYVFVEYDSLIRAPIAPLVRKVAADRLDFVTAHLREPGGGWFWEPHSRRAYPDGPLRASLNCVAILSNRALRHLEARRIAMARDPACRHWPIGEAFMATEITRSPFSIATLDTLGDSSALDWFPPVAEHRLDELAGAVFVHPVLDLARFRASLLRNTTDWRAFLRKDSATRRLLATLSRPPSRLTLLRAGLRRFRAARAAERRRRSLAAGGGGIEW